jgi:hypothetical protein
MAFGKDTLGLNRPYRRGVAAIGGLGRCWVLNEFNKPLTTVMFNLIVIQHQSFDVSVMYSSSLSVPLVAGPVRPGLFLFRHGLYAMPKPTTRDFLQISQAIPTSCVASFPAKQSLQ